MTPDHPTNFPQFLREREHAGEPRAALKAIYPPNLWPPEWADTDQEENDS